MTHYSAQNIVAIQQQTPPNPTNLQHSQHYGLNDFNWSLLHIHILKQHYWQPIPELQLSQQFHQQHPQGKHWHIIWSYYYLLVFSRKNLFIY